jgi:hypothetical protein
MFIFSKSSFVKKVFKILRQKGSMNNLFDLSFPIYDNENENENKDIFK